MTEPTALAIILVRAVYIDIVGVDETLMSSSLRWR